MKDIDNYVENLFTGLPVNEEAVKLKVRMKEDLNEKYENLMSNGKNADEALGIICRNFGSMQEIKYELCIDELIDKSDYQDILQQRKVKTYKLAFGVVCCIVALMMPVIFDELLKQETLGVIGFFSFIALGVYHIIMSFSYNVSPKELRQYAETEANPKKKKKRGFRFDDLVPLSVLFYLYMGAFHGGWHPWWIVIPGTAIVCEILDSIFFKN